MRFYEAFATFFANYFKQYSETPFEFEPKSSMVDKLIVLENVITQFYSDNHGGTVNFSNFRCAKNQQNFVFGHRGYLVHTLWHPDPASISLSHSHYFQDEFKPITPDDLQCFIQAVRASQRDGNICLDGKTQCFLSTEDSKNLLAAYDQFIKENPNHGTANATGLIKDVSTCGRKACAYAFASTIIQHVIKPILLGQNLTNKVVDAIGHILEGILLFVLSKSLLDAAAAFIIKNVISNLLPMLGINKDFAASFATFFTAIYAMSTNPAFLLKATISGAGGFLGMNFAMMLVLILGKFRPEPAIEYRHQNPTVIPAHQQRPGLVRRNGAAGNNLHF